MNYKFKRLVYYKKYLSEESIIPYLNIYQKFLIKKMFKKVLSKRNEYGYRIKWQLNLGLYAKYNLYSGKKIKSVFGQKYIHGNVKRQDVVYDLKKVLS